MDALRRLLNQRFSVVVDGLTWTVARVEMSNEHTYVLLTHVTVDDRHYAAKGEHERGAVALDAAMAMARSLTNEIHRQSP